MSREGTPPLAKMGAVLDKINVVIRYFALVIFFMSFATVIYGVLTRYALNRPQGWIDEVNAYFLVALCFLPLAWLQNRGEHIRIDTIFLKMGKAKQHMVNLVVLIVYVSGIIPLIWLTSTRAWETLQEGTRMDSLLGPPAFPLLALLPIGSFLLLLELIRQVAFYVSLLRSKTETTNKEVTV